MELQTSTHKLVLDSDHKYKLTVLDSFKTKDSWLDARSGEAFDRNLDVKVQNGNVHVLFESKDIGVIDALNPEQVNELTSFIHNWNLTVGPTDINATKLVEFLNQQSTLLKKRNLRVRMFSFNCGGKLADISNQPEFWDQLLGSIEADVLVLGFQETDSLNTNYRASATTLSLSSNIAMQKLKSTHTLVSTTQLLGLMTLVFINNDLVDECSAVKTDQTSTGLLGIWANKGATLTQFSMFKSKVVGGGLDLKFINCHLSAGDGEAQKKRRRWELKEIAKKFKVMGLVSEDELSTVSESSEDVEIAESVLYQPKQLVCILGDLNYRINLDESEAKKLVENGDISQLLTRDGLTAEQQAGEVFQQFVEPSIQFMPTYKFVLDSNEYKDRVPSYTDRILVQSSLPVEFNDYNSLSSIKCSDHKPVSMAIQMEIKDCLDHSVHQQITEQAMKLKDDAENNSRPKIRLSEQQINVNGPPLSSQTFYLEVENVGTRPVDWVVKAPQTSGDDKTENFQAERESLDMAVKVQTDQIHQFREVVPGVIVTPDHGFVDRKAPITKLRMQIAIGAKPTDHILVFETLSRQSVHQYVAIHVEPDKSYIGTDLRDMPLNEDGIPVPVKKCVDYLWDKAKDAKSKKIFDKCEPNLFQQVLSWLDADQPFDLEVLDAANQAIPDSSTYVVAQVLLSLYQCSTPLMTPSIDGLSLADKQPDSPDRTNLQKIIEYTCGFIKHFSEKDSNCVGLWAECLYDHLDSRAKHKEKVGYLESMLIAYA